MHVIIMADGQAKRWGNHNGVPKHLINIGGETLLERSVRLLKENGIKDITITTHRDDYHVDGTFLYAPENNEFEIDKFYASRPICQEFEGAEDTVFLYGDCYFSEDAIKAILDNAPEEFNFYGRFKGSEKTGKPWGEIFAVRLSPAGIARFMDSCKAIRDGVQDGSVKRGGAWELYRHINGQHPNSKHQIYGHFVEIDDETDDFDYPHDLEAWLVKQGL